MLWYSMFLTLWDIPVSSPFNAGDLGLPAGVAFRDPIMCRTFSSIRFSISNAPYDRILQSSSMTLLLFHMDAGSLVR